MKQDIQARKLGLITNIPEGLEKHPVIGASWVDVLAFCSWFSDMSGKSIDIPTEAQWLLASGYGDDQRRYSVGKYMVFAIL